MWQPHDDLIYPHRSHPWHPLDWTQNALCNPGNRTASKDTTHQGSVRFTPVTEKHCIVHLSYLDKGHPVLILMYSQVGFGNFRIRQQKMYLHHEKNINIIFKRILILWRRMWLFLSHHQASLWFCPGRFQNKRPVIKGWLLIILCFIKSGFVLWN